MAIIPGPQLEQPEPLQVTRKVINADKFCDALQIEYDALKKKYKEDDENPYYIGALIAISSVHVAIMKATENG